MGAARAGWRRGVYGAARHLGSVGGDAPDCPSTPAPPLAPPCRALPAYSISSALALCVSFPLPPLTSPPLPPSSRHSPSVPIATQLPPSSMHSPSHHHIVDAAFPLYPHRHRHARPPPVAGATAALRAGYFLRFVSTHAAHPRSAACLHISCTLGHRPPLPSSVPARQHDICACGVLPRFSRCTCKHGNQTAIQQNA